MPLSGGAAAGISHPGFSPVPHRVRFLSSATPAPAPGGEHGSLDALLSELTPKGSAGVRMHVAESAHPDEWMLRGCLLLSLAWCARVSVAHMTILPLRSHLTTAVLKSGCALQLIVPSCVRLGRPGAHLRRGRGNTACSPRDRAPVPDQV